MKSLSTRDLFENVMKHPHAKKSFLGFFPRDKLPRITTYPSSLIVNTDKHGEKGEHWLAIYVGKN